MPGIPAVELRALGDEQRRLLDICEALKADPAKWVRENDAQIAALKALLKEAREALKDGEAILREYAGLNDSPEEIPAIKPSHGNCCTCQKCGQFHDDCVCTHNELTRRLKPSRDLTARINKELGDD